MKSTIGPDPQATPPSATDVLAAHVARLERELAELRHELTAASVRLAQLERRIWPEHELVSAKEDVPSTKVEALYVAELSSNERRLRAFLTRCERMEPKRTAWAARRSTLASSIRERESRKAPPSTRTAFEAKAAHSTDPRNRVATRGVTARSPLIGAAGV